MARIKKTNINEIIELKRQIKEMNTKLTEYENIELENNIELSDDILEDVEIIEIHPNKYIGIMSLTFGKLALTTGGKGNGGKAIEFDHFGQVKKMQYKDIQELIDNNRSYAERGCFYILNQNVISNNGLKYDYENIKTKDVLENVLKLPVSLMKKTLESMNEFQFKVAVTLATKQMIESENGFDTAKAEVLGKLTGNKQFMQMMNDLRGDEDDD